MLLAIDVGNSNTSVGLFGRDRELHFLATLDTDSRKTADQICIDLMNLFALYQFNLPFSAASARAAIIGEWPLTRYRVCLIASTLASFAASRTRLTTGSKVWYG